MRWLAGAVGLLKKLRVEWWLASGVVFLVAAWAAGKWVALVPSFAVWGMVVGRGLWGVAGVSLSTPSPSFASQWRAWMDSGLGIPLALAVLLSWLFVAQPGWVLPEGLPVQLDGPHFTGWPVFAWCAWLLRPWGPLGFTRALVRMGCPTLAAFRLQSQAFTKNPTALLGLGALWVAGLGVLLAFPWVGLVAVFFWPFVLRCAFADIFEGGLSVAQPAQATAPVHATSGP